MRDWTLVEARVEQTSEVWNNSATVPDRPVTTFTRAEQLEREQAYDAGLDAVERELRRARTSPPHETKSRIVSAFGHFSARALDLNADAVYLLTNEFLPVGASLARWSRRFDSTLSMPGIIQAARNAWTACGLQPLLGEPIRLTPSILAYSLLYPYSDNHLDREDVSTSEKLHASRRFRLRLEGGRLEPANHRERALWSLVAMIEEQYPRALYPLVFECLLAIHRAQERSIAQSGGPEHVLRISCAKGGTSVLADACLATGMLSDEESRFAFEWGVLLQLGDDLQDVRDDMRRGSVTLFSGPGAAGVPLDALVVQLLNFAGVVGDRMDRLPHGSPVLKDLLRMSWRSLIVRAVADSHEFFTPAFLEHAEKSSPFRFDFLRRRQDRIAGRQGLYEMLFEAFLQSADTDGLPLSQLEETVPA